MVLEEDYRNQEALKVLRDFGEDEGIKNFQYCKLYELLEGHLL